MAPSPQAKLPSMSDPAGPPADLPAARSARYVPWLVLVLAGGLVYANSFAGVFLFDDQINIRDNPRVQTLWPPDWLGGQRPVVNFTIALNLELGGYTAWGFHLVNLAIHLGAGLVLFGVVRRSAERRVGWRAARDGAFAIALLWLVHPLQTQCVTYIIQRAEGLMSFFVLVTFYAAIRAHAAQARRGRIIWNMLATAACALALLAKPASVLTPVIIALYDRALLFPTWRAAVRSRWPLYLGLAASWILPAMVGVYQSLVAPAGAGDRVVGIGVPGVTPWTYLCTQAGVIVHYLRLVFWPDPLVLDYGWPMARGLRDAIEPGLLVLMLLVASVVALRRRPAMGFAGLCFFLMLAPTSSLMPVRDAAFEHRMYLPLAGVIAVVVQAGYGLIAYLMRDRSVARNIGMLAVGVAALALGLRTVARNRDYHDPVTLWRKNAADRPQNPRAQNNYCQALNAVGRDREALAACDKALWLVRDYPDALNNRANVLIGLGRIDDAAASARRALELRGDFADAHVTLGYALSLRGDYGAAAAEQRAALALQPRNVRAMNNLGNALARLGLGDEALQILQTALRLQPDRAETHNNIAWIHAARGDFQSAEMHLRQALAGAPDSIEILLNLGEVYVRLNQPADARAALDRAVDLAVSRGAVEQAEAIRARRAQITSP